MPPPAIRRTLAAVVAVLLPHSALAQLEEIIVTAQKRAESAQDVPIAVTAFDAAALTSPHLAGAALPAAVVAMPMVGRVAALIGTGRWSAPARPTGFGALFAGVTTDLALLISGVAVLAAAALGGGLALGARGVAVFMLGALVAWGVAALWQRHLHRRFGGITGDTLGALIEVSQAAFLLSLALFL